MGGDIPSIPLQVIRGSIEEHISSQKPFLVCSRKWIVFQYFSSRFRISHLKAKITLIVIINGSYLLKQVYCKLSLARFGLHSICFEPLLCDHSRQRDAISKPGLWCRRQAFSLYLQCLLACDVDHMTLPVKASALGNVDVRMDETAHIKCLMGWLTHGEFIKTIWLLSWKGWRNQTFILRG